MLIMPYVQIAEVIDPDSRLKWSCFWRLHWSGGSHFGPQTL